MKTISAIAQTFILTSFSVLSLFAVTVQAASFKGLGFLDSNNQYKSSYVNGVSANGSVIVGGSRNSNGRDEAFLWTQEGGMVGLSFFDGRNSVASGVSADGSIIVGGSSNGISIKAFRWTQESGMVELGSFDGFNTMSGANAVSADGSIIVGVGINANGDSEAFRWTEESGMVGLGFLPLSSCLPPDSSCNSYPLRSGAYGISADGSIVIGENFIGSGYVPALWTHEGGISSLDEGASYGNALGISANGSVIVGGYSKAFRWTQSSGMVLLDDYAKTDEWSYARGVSADSSIIVGSSNVLHGTSGPMEAFLWTQETGMVSLKETLIGAGLDVRGWSLFSAQAISADGFTIVGNGRNPSGQTEAWVANLSPEPVPEPLTILGSIAAIAFGAGFERKFNKDKSEEKDPED